MAKFRNLLPHAINVRKSDGTWLTLESDGDFPIVYQSPEKVGEIEGVGISGIYFHLDTLPPPEPDTYLIVPDHIANHPLFGYRSDLLMPGPPIFSGYGNAYGYNGLKASHTTARWLRGDFDDCLDIVE